MDSGRDRQVKLPAVKLFHDFIPYSREKDFNAEFDRLRFYFVSKTATVEDFIKNTMSHLLCTQPDLTLAVRKTLTGCITDEQISLLITVLYEGNASAEYYSSLALETIWFSKYSKDASELKAFTRVIDELTRLAATKDTNVQKSNELIKEFCLRKIYYKDPAAKKILGKGEVYNEALGHLVFMLTNNQISLGGINEGPLQLFFSNTEEELRLKRGLQAFFLVDPVEDIYARGARSPKAGEISYRQLKSFCHVALSGKTSVAPDDLTEEDWLPQVKACYPFYVMYMNQCLTSSASVLCSQIAAEMKQKSASLTSGVPPMAQPSHWATQFQPVTSPTTSFTPTQAKATEQTTPKLY